MRTNMWIAQTSSKISLIFCWKSFPTSRAGDGDIDGDGDCYDDDANTGTRAALNPAVADSQQRRRRKLNTPTTNCK